jgi:membrane-associated protease RseP (regulator of RpoE activity)
MSKTLPREKNFLDQTLDATVGNLLGILSLRRYRPAIKLSSKSGEIIVSEIHKGTHAERSGIRVGDIILEINDQTVTSVPKDGKPTPPTSPSDLESFAYRLLEVDFPPASNQHT